MNEFVNKTGMVLRANFRQYTPTHGKNAGRKVANVVLTLDNGDNVFVSPRQITDIIAYEVTPKVLPYLQGSTAYYEVSDVKAGDDFTFSQGGDLADEPAASDLSISNLNAVLMGDATRRQFEEHGIATIGNDDDWAAAMATNEPATPTPEAGNESEDLSAEEIVADIEACGNATLCKEAAAKYDVFDDISDELNGMTSAAAIKTRVKEHLEANPF